MRTLLTLGLALIPTTARSQTAATLPASTEDAMRLATTPDHRLEENDWWADRHAAKLAERDAALASGQAINLVFVGDSITHSWERQAEAKRLWDERFAPRGAFNLGYSGDRTEHVLWRLGLGDAGAENNELAGLSPKLFVVMIGTNNTGHRMDSAEATAAGIERIVDRLQELAPESHVLLLGVFPRGVAADDPMRVRNAEINGLIAALGERERVEFLEIGSVFLDADGTLPAALMPDALHPRAAGYRLWADAIEEPIARLLGE